MIYRQDGFFVNEDEDNNDDENENRKKMMLTARFKKADGEVGDDRRKNGKRNYQYKRNGARVSKTWLLSLIVKT